MTAQRNTTRVRSAARSQRWEHFTDEELLGLRFRDLKLRIADSPVHRDVERVVTGLTRRGIAFKPHVWFSTDWFSPDGVPGIAVPFFLGHPRLLRLEQRMMGEAEGNHRRWRLRLLRHELGHAIDTAFALRRRPDWRRVFGSVSAPYPSSYAARPRSREHVLHLEHWYAQSHSTEDFAETFAVWLAPKARWRTEYAGWPALAKLEFVDRLMAEIAGRPPRNRDRSVVAPLADNNRTLREHYRRRAHWHADVGRYDGWLTRAFQSRSPRAPSAERFLLGSKAQLSRSLLRYTREPPYLIFQVLRALRRRARELDLGVGGSKQEALRAAIQLHERVVRDVLRRDEETYFL